MSTWNPGSVPPLPRDFTAPDLMSPAPIGMAMPGAVDALGVVQIDLACRRCSYNLRGLRDAGVCPECATPVGRSLQGDLLRFADPDWVDRLALGGRLIMIGLTLSVLLGFMGGALAALAGVATTTSTTLSTSSAGVSYSAVSTTTTPGFWPQVLAHAVLLPAWLVTLYGAWLITTPDPSGLGEERYARSRKLVRIGVVAALANAALNVLGNIFPTLSTNPFAAGNFVFLILLGVIGALMQLVAAGSGLAYIRYLSQLVDRVPDPDLARFGRRVFGVAIVVGVLFLATVLLTLVVMLSPPTAGAGAVLRPGTGPGPGIAPASGLAAVVLFGAAGCFTALMGLVLFLMYLRFQHLCGKTFREQALIARGTWAGQAIAAARPA